MGARAIPILILAAGRSTRMGANKLLAEAGGQPLIRHAVTAALESQGGPVLVVLGHQAERVREALHRLDVSFVDNPEHGEGMAASLRHGVAALPAGSPAVLVGLGDMPLVRPCHYDALIEAYGRRPESPAVLPTHHGRRGHPVLLSRMLFAKVLRLSGDQGARRLLADAVEVAVGDAGILQDVDTPEALARLAW